MFVVESVLVDGLAYGDDVSVPLVAPLPLVFRFWFTFVLVLTLVLSVVLEPDVDGLALGLSVVVVAPCALSVVCVPEPTLVDELWLVDVD